MNEPREERRWGGLAWRAAAGVGALGSVALGGLSLVRRLGPTSSRAARGDRSHTPDAAALRAGYEVKDLSAAGLTKILALIAGTAGTLIGIVFLMIWLFGGWDRADTAGLTAQQTASIAVPGPHLQMHPFRDRALQGRAEANRLAYYGWNDPSHATAHVPIDRAMVLVTGQSLDPSP